jgi:excisionase family DNA binding protein
VWLKTSKAAKYAGVSVNTLRAWTRDGLQYSRPMGGAMLFNTADIDKYLRGYQVGQSESDALAEEVLADLQG